MATFSDNFDRADNTDIGSNWTEVTQDVAILSNTLVNNTTNKSGHLVTATGFTPSDADYQVQADVTIKNVANNLSATGVIGRCTDSTHFYMARIAPNAFQLYKFNAGATLLGSTTPTVNLGTTYNVKLSMSGSTIRGYLDGVLQVEVTDTALTSTGNAGVRIFPDNTGTPAVGDSIIDNFLVDDLVASASLSPSASQSPSASLSPSSSSSASQSPSASLSPSSSNSASRSPSASLSPSSSASASQSPSASLSPSSSSSASLSPSSSSSASTSPSSSASASQSPSASASPSSGAPPMVKVWTGASWEYKPLKFWDGANWL